MKVTGIIAEYNPFHNGHAYHLEETRKHLGSDYIVVVMSGNYVQRGAPTIIDKYSRCEMALRSGADLVLELPSCYSTASAEYFAFGGIAILDKLGVVDHLSFGTESLDQSLGKSSSESDQAAKEIIQYFDTIADFLLNETPECREIIQEDMRSGMSHAAAVADAVSRLLGEDYCRVMETSNNILGVEYMKALRRLSSPIIPVPLARRLTEHNDDVLQAGFSSASAIRNAIFNKYDMNSLAGTLPEAVYNILMDRYLETFPIFRDDFSTVLGSKLLDAKIPEDLTRYFGVPEILANRMLNLKNQFRSFNQFRMLVNTKSLNRATVGRALMHITLDITKADMEKLYHRDSLQAVKVLGFRRSAEPLLSEIKKKSRIKLVTKLADYVPGEGVDMIEQTIRADMFYRMICMNKFDVELPTPYEEPVRII